MFGLSWRPSQQAHRPLISVATSELKEKGLSESGALLGSGGATVLRRGIQSPPPSGRRGHAVDRFVIIRSSSVDKTAAVDKV